MIRHRVPISFTVGLLALTLACGKQPVLDVQQQGEDAPAPQAPASEPAAESPALISARAPAAAELPAAHPPTDGLPADHPPLGAAAEGAMQLAQVAAEAGQGAAALVWTAPAGWVSEPPANTMRRAQYRVPGPGGEGECVVFYFGPGQGGDAQSNAERWASQFTGADGRPAEAQTANLTVNGIDVLHVEAAGTYQSGSMMGTGRGVPKPDWAILGAVAQGPDANWFFKFTAPKATIDAHRAAFDSMVASLRRAG